jgi:hypothetical protein
MRVRRLLDYELKEFSFAAQQAIAHPDALVASVKTAPPAAVPPSPSSSLPAPAPLPAPVPAPLPPGAATPLPASTARHRQLSAQWEEIDRYCREQQRRQVDLEIREREEAEQRAAQSMEHLRALASMRIPRTFASLSQSPRE